MTDREQQMFNDKCDELRLLQRELFIPRALRARMMKLDKAGRAQLLSQLEALLR